MFCQNRQIYMVNSLYEKKTRQIDFRTSTSRASTLLQTSYDRNTDALGLAHNYREFQFNIIPTSATRIYFCPENNRKSYSYTSLLPPHTSSSLLLPALLGMAHILGRAPERTDAASYNRMTQSYTL